MDYYHRLAWGLDPTRSSLSNGNESFSHSIAFFTGILLELYSVLMFSLCSFYFEGHHIIMVIHRSKLCKIKARNARYLPTPLWPAGHCAGDVCPSLWWLVMNPRGGGCCHHTSAARSDLNTHHSSSFVTLSRDWLITTCSHGDNSFIDVKSSSVPKT